MSLSLRFVHFLSIAGALTALIACDGGSNPNPSGGAGSGGTSATGTFESANPSADATRGRNAAGGGTASAGGSGAGPSPAPNDGGDASRVIAEADIIQIEGDTLYALSQYGGLSAIDIGTQDKLTLLGRLKVVATPFEMYIKQGIVFALYQGYGEYVHNADDSWQWVQTSHVVVIDARDPANLKELSKFEVPGYIADSRMVGDILYVASFEDGYCWDCEANKPQTTVISLDVSIPAAVTKVDQITFDERQDYSWHRSIFVTDQRMYVAGPQWGATGPVGSTIQVIDISDPAGDMVEGATLQVAGQINNRWQMDEFNGVFRVISQSPDWNLSEPPHVQTYTVVSSNELSPLGNIPLTLPRPEQLQSVRFDGTRAYAITFERTDPLFTIDLTDPAAPVQAGQLEMPGWLYYMEPRGDRLIGLGFDSSVGTGTLNVSLFDVSDLSAPTLIDRVNFGGDWGWFAEDQDRIHKAFKVLDDAGLILMPFSGWVNDSTNTQPYCAGTWRSGIQLIDWASDTLTLRGVAPTQGSARRGFLHNDRLFAMSDDRVETFDISDRDTPATTAKVALAHNVTQVVPVADKVLRIGQNWWTNATQIDAVSVDQATTPTTEGDLEIALNSDGCYKGEYLQGAFSSEQRAFLVFQRYDYDPVTGVQDQSTRVSTVDAAGATPEIVGTATIASGQNNNYYSYYTPYGLIDHGEPMVAVGSTLVSAHTEVDYGNSAGAPRVTVSELNIADLSDPNQAQVSSVELPTGLGTTGLVQSGTVVARSHYEASAANPDSVRFFLDRVNVENPANPQVLDAINIPGSLLAFDQTSERAFTVDYRSETQEDVLAPDCYVHPYASFFPQRQDLPWEATPGTCVQILYSIKLIAFKSGVAKVIGSYELVEGEAIGQLALGDNVAFLALGNGYRYYYYYGYPVGTGAAVDCFGACYGGSFTEQELPVLTVSGLQDGNFKVGRLSVHGGDSWGYAPMVAHGTRAALSSGWRGKLSVIDASDVEAPRLVRDVEINGYVNSLTLVGDTAVAAMGYDGVQTISLGN
ncbi:MAG TPA: beta-propeller domain-containing protein [Polyangiaceae bacterium]|nr:beta-propeller domain-containing protein [Polyangiaceae bacterium]